MNRVSTDLRNFINNNVWTNEDGETQVLNNLTLSEVAEIVDYLTELKTMNENYDGNETLNILINHSINKLTEYHKQLLPKNVKKKKNEKN